MDANPEARLFFFLALVPGLQFDIEVSGHHIRVQYPALLNISLLERLGFCEDLWELTSQG